MGGSWALAGSQTGVGPSPNLGRWGRLGGDVRGGAGPDWLVLRGRGWSRTASGGGVIAGSWSRE